MSTRGDRVQTIDGIPVILTVDATAVQADGHTWLATHDDAGVRHYVSGEDVVRVGRHSEDDPALVPAVVYLTGIKPRTWPQGRGSTVCGFFTDPHQALPIPDPTGLDTTYRIVFDHLVGQPVDELVLRASSAVEVADIVQRYVRPKLIGPDVVVEVDLDALVGRVMYGLRVLGSFTIEHEVLPPPSREAR